MAEVLNAFELERQQLIARNRARLLALGIPEAVSGLSALVPTAAAKPKSKRQKRTKAGHAEPIRHSGRLQAQEMIARGELPPDIEEGSELAMFITDGECPRCGKGLHTGHARHLQSCKGPPEAPTKEGVAARANAYRSVQKERLRQLELGGLVDYQPGASAGTTATAAGAEQQQTPVYAATEEPDDSQQTRKERATKGKTNSRRAAKRKQPEEAEQPAAAAGAQPDEPYATFIVIGSTGNHYVVKLIGHKRSCTCMDHRIRRRDCKHICLILKQLGVADEPQQWQQAIERQGSGFASADASDVSRVRQAEARAQARREKAAIKRTAS